MIDLAIELADYGNNEKPNRNSRDAEWESILNEPRCIGKLSDMQDQGFMTEPSPPAPWIKRIKSGAPLLPNCRIRKDR